MANKPVATRGILLSYGTDSTANTKLYSITSTPKLGGAPEMIETTTLQDTRVTGIPGIPGNDALEFKGNIGKYGAPGALETALVDEYAALEALAVDTPLYWKLLWPDGSYHTWQGYPSVSPDEAEVNSKLTYTLTIIPCTDFTFTPAA